MKKSLAVILLAAVMAAGPLSLTSCTGGKNTAATMHLRRAEGTVAVSNDNGKDVPVLDNLGLYSGYGVGTQSASYAWISLDDIKLTKLDQNSEITIQKEGKALDIQLKSGGLFFNVTEPLADDETMDIRTSTMLVGIRGTCGWVNAGDSLSQVYILEGKVDCSARGKTVRVSAGEMGALTADGELVVKPFTADDLPAFVRDEVDPDLPGGPDETPGPESTETPEPAPTPVPEPTPAPQDITWALNNGTLTISGTGPMEDYSIADVGAPWYGDRDSITEVVIEDGVTRIGFRAFEGCSGMTGVTIPDSVTSIGAGAFNGCSSLTSVTIPNSVTSIGEQAFFYCTSLTSVTIGDGVTSIGGQAFQGCSNLTGITIPNNLTSIEKQTFTGCSSLTGITIPDGVTSIGGGAFYDCGSLMSVTIPASVTFIGDWVFSYCGSLTDVYYGGSESQWEQINFGLESDGLRNAAIHYS